MRATFGNLQDQQLSLQPGLNCIYAPNESGKSTWSHFLRIMLYGLNTRDRGLLADKNRFAPWSGAAMRGQIQVADSDGTQLTLSRDTRRANAPMGHFTCSYTGTATAVPGIDGQNAGETLLGVPREVFERSAFIRQSALAVDSDAELERRIAALITTGEEDVSYTEVRERLKKQLNRRRSNRATGQIPVLEREISDLEGQLAQMDSLSQQADAARQQLESLTRQQKELQTQQALWQQLQQQEAAQKYAAAQTAAQEATHRAAWLAETAGPLPEEDTLTRLEGQCTALEEAQTALGQAQAAEKAAQKAAEEAKALYTAHPLYPDDDTACRARLDRIAAPKMPSPLPVAGIVLLLAGAVLAFFSRGAVPQVYLYGALALIGLVMTGVSLLLRGKAKKAQEKAATDRAALEAQMAEYLPLRQRYEGAARQAAQAAAAADGLAQIRQQQLLTLLSGLRPYAPTVAPPGGARVALTHLRQQKNALNEAQRTAREAALRQNLLREHLPEGPLPDTATALPRPSLSPEQVTARLSQTSLLLQNAQSRLDTLTGQLRSLGSADDLTTQLQQRRQQLAQLQEEYDAIALAMEVLDDANTTLQNRFSPALGARAAEIFAKITGGRYQKVLLSRDFSLETDSEGAQRSVQLLSQGASDQLYLAVRLAICDMVLPAEKRVPLVLDDALLSFDDDRLHAALDYLLEESERRQILLFTCQKRESAYLAGHKNVTLLAI